MNIFGTYIRDDQRGIQQEMTFDENDDIVKLAEEGDCINIKGISGTSVTDKLYVDDITV